MPPPMSVWSGPHILQDGTVRFALWAPDTASMAVMIDGETAAMTQLGGGWWELRANQARVGTLYQFVLPDGLHVPDPASRFQPQDAHGPSEVVDPKTFGWTDQAWEGQPWHETILYELHVGSFTLEGTFLAAIEKLDHLAALGVNTIEIMPVADFPGTRNWGYDGVLLFAPDSTYGRPEHLKALIDAAHAKGISVVLDVVYNHFGPDGNYFPSYASAIFTDRHCTPWGNAVNYDGPGSDVVRELVIQNALYWIDEFHFDGLRFDAVHEIKDDSPRHLLDELAQRVRASVLHRPVHLILENEKNEAHRLSRRNGAPESFTAQWNDDMHHVLHTVATLEAQGYYGDFEGDPEKLGKALAEGFAFQGEVMKASGKPRGEDSAQLPPTAFVAFMQNHDQIGNRAFGERINQIASPEAVRAVAATYLLLPQVPMLFMGEEWASSKPFPFFCDFAGELGGLVSQGRRDEFASFPAFQDSKQRERIPDPQASETFQLAKLDWEQVTQGVHADWFAWYQRILRIRKEQIFSLIPLIRGNAGTYRVLGKGAVKVEWELQGGGDLRLTANLSEYFVDSVEQEEGHTLWQEGLEAEGQRIAPWSVHWSVRLKEES